jgi:hypothetical protein
MKINRGLPDLTMSYNPTTRLDVDPLKAVIAGALGAARKRRRRSHGAAHFGAKRGAAWRQRWGKLSRAARLAKMKEIASKATAAQKVKILAAAVRRKALLAKRAAMVKAAIKKSPKLRKRVARKLLQQRLYEARQFPSPSAVNEVPQGAAVGPPPAESPVQPAVEEDHVPTPAEQVEAMEDNAAEETAEAVDATNAEASDEAEQEVATDADETQKAENDEELTEPSKEEAAEDAAAEVEADTDATNDDDGDDASAGASIMGMLGAAMRKKARAKAIHAAAVPTAHAMERKSGGKIKAKTTLQGCALIQAAKAGNSAAKAAIKTLQTKAARGDAAAKKAVAQLKLCNRVVKKARKTVAKKVKGGKVRRGGPANVYKDRVPIVSRGLASYSAHQRGLAMIPAFARTMFRPVRGA